MSDAASEACSFLHDLYGGDIPDGLYLNIWTAQNKQSYWARKIDEAVEVSMRLRHTMDVYFGPGLSAADLGPGRRCAYEDVSAIPGLWADMDVGKIGHKKQRYPDSIEAVDDLLQRHSIPPTGKNGTGGGAHGFWKFPKLWQFGDAEDRQQAVELSEGWKAHLKTIFARHGYEIDSTQDLPHVFRVPGTYNRKVKDNIRLVQRLDWDRDRTYSVKALEKIVAPYAGRVTVERATKTQMKMVIGDIVLDPQAEVDPEIISTLRWDYPRFAKAWARKIREFTSQSDYDLSIMSIACYAGLSDQTAVNLALQHRRDGKEDPKLRDSYWVTTLYKAKQKNLIGTRDPNMTMELQAKIALAAQGISDPSPQGISDPSPPKDAPDDEPRDLGQPEPQNCEDGDCGDSGQKRKNIPVLNEILAPLERTAIQIASLAKIDSEEPEYEMRFTDGTVLRLGKIENLVTQSTLRNQMATRTGVLFGPIKASDWRKIQQIMLDACEIHDLGHENSSLGTAEVALVRYLQASIGEDGVIQASDENGRPDQATLRQHTPFRDATNPEHVSVYISAEGFRAWAATDHVILSTVAAAKKLRAAGCERTEINVRTESSRSKPAFWKVPAHLIPDHNDGE